MLFTNMVSLWTLMDGVKDFIDKNSKVSVNENIDYKYFNKLR